MAIERQQQFSRPRGSRAAVRSSRLSTEDWEQRIGEQFRRSRLNAGLDQSQLADLSDVSIGALRNLERGNGSTVKTLVRVARALGREDWLDGFSPAVRLSPIDVLRSAGQPRRRVYRARRVAPGGTDGGS